MSSKVVRQAGEQPGENKRTTEEHEREQDGPESGERRMRRGKAAEAAKNEQTDLKKKYAFRNENRTF